MEECKTEIVGTFQKEIEGISSLISTLVNRIDNLEMKCSSLGKRVEDIERGTESIKLDVMEEMRDRERRRHNVIVAGLPEETDGSARERQTVDMTRIHNIFNGLIDVETAEITRIHRIGKTANGRPRLIRVVMTNENTKKALLYNAKKLRMSEHRNIFINNDLTITQRKARKALHDELTRRRNAGEDIIIRHGQIVTRDPNQNFHNGF